MKQMIAILLAGAFLLAGCQVNGKPVETGSMQTDAPQYQAAADKSGTIAIEIPDRFKTQCQSDDGRVVITANAPVTVLGNGSYPIQRVIGVDFSQEIVDRVIAVLLPGAMLYNIRTERIKEDVQDDLVRLIAKRERYAEMGMLDAYDGKMSELKTELASAPESVPEVPYDGKLHTMLHDYGEYMANYQGLHIGESAKEQDLARYLHMENNSDQTAPFSSATFSMPVTKGASMTFIDNRQGQMNGKLWQDISDVSGQTTVDALAEKYLKLTPADAEYQATALLAALGISAQVNETRLMGVGEMDDNHEFITAPTEFAYSVRCISTIGGAPQIPCKWTASLKDESGKETIQWTYEAVTVRLNDDGIMQLEWNSPHAIGETIAESAQLLPFVEIQAVFEKIMPLMQHEKLVEPDVQKLQINISQVYLGQMRITKEGNYDQAILTPVWAFYGTQSFVHADGATEDYDYGNSIPLIAINAVDGSVIDVSEGY